MSGFVPVAATVTSSPPASPANGGSPRYRRRSGSRSYFQPTPPSPEDLAYAAHLSLQQIEFLFSADNLAMDQYLRSLFDMEGYVPLLYIAQYPAVASYGATWEGLKEQVRKSKLLEFQEENETIRLIENWKMWLNPGVNHRYARPQPLPNVAQVMPTNGSVPEAATQQSLQEQQQQGSAHTASENLENTSAES